MADYIRHQRGRMFQSDFFEFFSKVHPAAPFVFWIPVTVGAVGYALMTGQTTLPWVAALMPLGYVTWQFMEYFIHKLFFHWEGSGPFTRWLHQVTHGFHHQYPDDDNRLVMPLPVSIGAGALIAFGLQLLVSRTFVIPYFFGIVSGYLWYDFLHWSTHFRKPLTAWGRALRAHHMSHHFADHETNFGISHRWIDRLLGTLKKSRRDAGAENANVASPETVA
jgi:dihydroceramide fatty acyl 2-hydroxylase